VCLEGNITAENYQVAFFIKRSGKEAVTMQ